MKEGEVLSEFGVQEVAKVGRRKRRARWLITAHRLLPLPVCLRNPADSFFFRAIFFFVHTEIREHAAHQEVSVTVKFIPDKPGTPLLSAPHTLLNLGKGKNHFLSAGDGGRKALIPRRGFIRQIKEKWEGRGKRKEERGKREEGRGKREEGRGKRKEIRESSKLF